MASQPVSKYHAKVRIDWDGLETELNIFSDSLLDLYRDLNIVTHATSDDIRDVLDDRAACKAEDAAQSVPALPASDAPACQNCGTAAHMELIEFTDRETGERKARWKCQQCQQWHWPERKNGRRPARSRG